MKKKILIGSIIAVVLLVLVSFSSVVGKVSLDDELVEFDVEFCGLGKKHTVQLTQQEADEVELLFDGIEQQLSEVETREEAEEIFKETILELDRYGLLGGLSVKQALRLVIEGFQNKLWNYHSFGTLGYSDNLFCLVAGRTDNTEFFGLSIRVLWSIYNLLPYPFNQGFANLLAPIIQWNYYKPFFIVTDVVIDSTKGWLWTNGLMGSKIWTGEILGYQPPKDGTAMFGFKGIRILLDIDISDNLYFGHAVQVRIYED